MLGLYRNIGEGTFSRYRNSIDTDPSLLPVITTHDGILGQEIVLNLFLRNGDINRYYTNISIIPYSTSGNDEISGLNGFGIKILRQTAQPSEAEWEGTDYGAYLSFPDIGDSLAGDISTYHSFWYRVEVPAGTPITNRSNTSLRISYTENVVE